MANQFVLNLHKTLDRTQEAFLQIDTELAMKRLEKAKRKPVKLSEGCTALLFTKGTKDKLTCLWTDVVSITRVLSPNTVEIQYPSGEREEVPRL